MTNADMEMAEEAHDLALSIYKENAADADYGEPKGFPVVPLIIGILLLAAAAIAVGVYTRSRAKKRA